jgi:hypothetical protein
MRLEITILYISLILNSSCVNKTQSEELQWKSKVVDLGKFEYGGKIHLNYTFKNISDHPISIMEIIPGCDCTSIDDFSKKITNGQTGEINISYDSKKGIIGPFRKDLFVFFEGTKDSVVTLYYTGIVTGNK